MRQDITAGVSMGVNGELGQVSSPQGASACSDQPPGGCSLLTQVKSQQTLQCDLTHGYEPNSAPQVYIFKP